MINLKKVVVAYDSCEHSKKALDWAIHMAQLTHATIDVIMVLVPSAISTRSADAYASHYREAMIMGTLVRFYRFICVSLYKTAIAAAIRIIPIKAGAADPSDT